MTSRWSVKIPVQITKGSFNAGFQETDLDEPRVEGRPYMYIKSVSKPKKVTGGCGVPHSVIKRLDPTI